MTPRDVPDVPADGRRHRSDACPSGLGPPASHRPGTERVSRTRRSGEPGPPGSSAPCTPGNHRSGRHQRATRDSGEVGAYRKAPTVNRHPGRLPASRLDPGAKQTGALDVSDDRFCRKTGPDQGFHHTLDGIGRVGGWSPRPWLHGLRWAARRFDTGREVGWTRNNDVGRLKTSSWTGSGPCRTRGWTLEEMGKQFEAAGYGAGSRQAMMQLEGGDVKRLTLNQVQAAAVAFEVPPLALLTTEDLSPGRSRSPLGSVFRLADSWSGGGQNGRSMDDPGSSAWFLLSAPRWLSRPRRRHQSGEGADRAPHGNDEGRPSEGTDQRTNS